MPTQRLGVGEFFDFYGCRLFFLVNERNSVMAKVMPISRRLVYELRFLQEARSCRELLQGQQQQAALERLDEIITAKQALQPSLFWNATFDSPEMAAAFSSATTPLDPTETEGFHASLAALEYFINLLQHQQIPDISTLEEHYKQLASHHYGGRFSQSLTLLNTRLAVLNLALAAQPQCPDADQEAVWQQLAMALTPLDHALDTLEHQGERWLGALNQLLDLIPVVPPTAFQDYHRVMLDTQGGLWQDFRRHLETHQQLRRQWLRRCAPDALAG